MTATRFAGFRWRYPGGSWATTLPCASRTWIRGTSSASTCSPNGDSGPTSAELQQSWSDMTNFARCMRSHGVPNWPDPTRYPAHPERPTFDLQPVGIDPRSPQISTQIHQCEPLLHGNNPQRLGEVGS
jgi:hypothetical protein